MKILLSILILAVILAILFILGVGYYLYQTAIVRKENNPVKIPEEKISAAQTYYYTHQERQMAWLENWGYETVEITNKKEAKLVGYYFKAKQNTARTVLAIHGYRSDAFKEYMYMAPMYLEQLGMNLLLVDNYAHHNSEGKHIGFGYKDHFDTLKWCQWIIDHNGLESKIFLQGVSMGAATVLMTAGDKDLPDQVQAVIADCGYSSLKEQLNYMLKTIYHVPIFPFYWIADGFCRMLAGYSFGQADTLKYTRSIKIPVLLIHGDADKFVPTPMVYDLYDACNSDKTLKIVPDAGHAESFLVDQIGYLNAVKKIVETNI